MRNQALQCPEHVAVKYRGPVCSGNSQGMITPCFRHEYLARQELLLSGYLVDAGGRFQFHPGNNFVCPGSVPRLRQIVHALPFCPQPCGARHDED